MGIDIKTIKIWVDEATGLKCAVNKHVYPEINCSEIKLPERKHYCGYVFFKRKPSMIGWSEYEFSDFIDINGGITWLRDTEDGLTQMGFDTAHCWDFERNDTIFWGISRWTDDMAIRETEYLAKQVFELLENK